MQKFSEYLLDSSGNPITTADIAVYYFGTTTLAPLFATATGVAIANPITSQLTTGLFEFYAADGKYTLVISELGYQPRTLAVEIINDQSPVYSTLTGAYQAVQSIEFDPAQTALRITHGTSATVAEVPITSSEITNGTSNVSIASPNGDVTATVNGTAALTIGEQAVTLPKGTTAQQPTPAVGMIRFNTETSKFEVYEGISWKTIVTARNNYLIEYLVVGGGGAASGSQYGDNSGGGGGGGYRTATTTALAPGDSYTVIVGAGGTTSTYDGNGSTFESTTSAGGGAGYAGAANNGGSGGGGGSNNTFTTSGGLGNTPATVPSQGNNGGGNGGFTFPRPSGGGGGASTAGQTAPNASTSGNGGDGLTWLNGVTYAGGGGGSGNDGVTPGAGGAGGGGGGNYPGPGTDGGPNTGGGAGGSPFPHVGANGGSGIVILRYFGAQQGTGGTVTSAGGYTYHTFTSSGTYIA